MALDKLVSAYCHARVDVDVAARALTKATPHNAADRDAMKRAVVSLQHYLGELEKA